MGSETKKRRIGEPWREMVPETLREIADAAARILRESAGMDAEQAAYLGYLIMRAIAEAAGGAQIYIPRAAIFSLHERDVEIWRSFDGKNTRELARKYNVTEIHIYRILKRMRTIEAKRRQQPTK